MTNLIRRLAAKARRAHYSCDDSWYSCPKHPEGSANDAKGDACDCGADHHNMQVNDLVAELLAAQGAGPWIRSEDRLPAHARKVLVYSPGYQYAIHRLALWGGERTWESDAHGYEVEGTYWRELPAPPKEERT